MKTNTLRFVLLILLGLSALQFNIAARAQGLVALSPVPNQIKYTTDGTTLISVPIGNPAIVGTYGQLNIALVYSPTASSGLFSATTAGLLTGDWTQASPVASRISSTAGTLLLTTVTVGATSPEESFVVAWTGTYATWNAAWQANTGNNILFGWSGSALSGGSLGWSQGNLPPPSTPVATVSGADGFAGLVLASYPTPPPPPPPITTQPASMSVVLGSNATFSVVAPGTWVFLWYFDGNQIYGHLYVDTLTITNAQFADAGSYSVYLAYDDGSRWSSNAVLQVLPFGGPSIQINNQLAVGTLSAAGFAQLTISGGFTNGFIFYTLDGTTPTTNSPLYTGPVTLTSTAAVQAMGLSADSSQSAVSPAVTVIITPAFALQTSAAGGGTITVNPTTGPYTSNTVVAVTAHATAYWAFDHWTGDLAGSQNPANITMSGPRSVQAVFRQTNPASMELGMYGMYAGIVITAAAGNTYEIQYCTDLRNTNVWVALTNFTMQQPVELWVDTSVSAFTKAHRYYSILPWP